MAGTQKKLFCLISVILIWFGNASAAENTIVPMVPSAIPIPGIYNIGQKVALNATGAASICYTTDGKNPNCDTGNIYSGPIAIMQTQTIRARSCYGAGVVSPSAELVYTIKPPVAAVVPQVAGAATEHPNLAEMELMVAELRKQIQAIIEKLAQRGVAPSTVASSSAVIVGE